MKAPLKSVVFLLTLVLAGCTHKTQQAQNQPLAPPIVDTPPPPPQPTPTELPPPVVVEPQPQPEPTPPPKTAPKPAKHVTRHPKPDASKTTEQASNASGASAVSAIGQLSPGDSGDQRSQTEQSIASIDQELKKITRPLNDQEQKTAGQIREFLKQARAALLSGDVDGAHTLAVKARVLLGELSK